MERIKAERENHIVQIELWRKWVATVTGFLSVFLTVAANTCNNIILKYVIIGLLTAFFLITSPIVYSYFNYKKTPAVIVLYIVWFLLYIFLGVYVFTKKCEPDNNAKTVNNSPVTKSESTTTIIDKSTHTDNSKTNIFNKLPQRTINRKDIADLKARLPEKDAQILVQYLSSKREDTLLWKQVYKTLSEIGYLDVRLSPAQSLPDNLHPGRFTIEKDKIDSKNQYIVIINPQQ